MNCFRTVLILTWKMHWCISQRGWPCHDWPGRTSASRTARAPQCTAAVESLCRYLSFARDRRPTLSVDCRRCWLPVHLHLDASLCTCLIATDKPPNLLYHIGLWYNFRSIWRYDDGTIVSPRRVSLSRYMRSLIFRLCQLHTECFFFILSITTILFCILHWNIVSLLCVEYYLVTKMILNQILMMFSRRLKITRKFLQTISGFNNQFIK